MPSWLHRQLPQPLIGTVTVAVGMVALVLALIDRATGIDGALAAWLAPSLVTAVVLAYQFPIYVRHNTKITFTTVPIFMMAVLLPPAVAGLAIGLAVLFGEIAVRSQRGSLPSDIATHVGRWMALGVAASFLAHVDLGGTGSLAHAVPAAAAAIFLWTGDILTLPLALGPINGERPARIIFAAIREGGGIEGAQYLVGLLGALVVNSYAWALLLLALPTMLVYLAFRKEIDQDTRQLLENMADTVDLRDPYTGGHSKRVADLTEGILQQLGMHGQEATLVLVAARLHDIGKIGLPDSVLIKPESLTTEERTLMEDYPARGAELLGRYPDFARGVEMVKHHHERWDGTGYPHHLRGTDIPFGARLIAVADAFDALTNDRPYRRALSVDRAAAILAEGRGVQWDPDIVDAFLRSIADKLSQPGEITAVRPQDLGSAASA